jgi:Spy/CpxP family protein refolding chaperone
MRTARSLVVALALVLVTAASTPAQHGTAGHSHTGSTPSTGHLAAQACQAEFDSVIADGRGFGLAFAADQNGYPGPLHVLELKDRLRLTSEQEGRAQALLDAMFAEARPKSARLLAAEAQLRDLFARRTVDDTSLAAAVAAVEHARADVRLVHLRTHLKMRDVLTEDQRLMYHAARWTK